MKIALAQINTTSLDIEKNLEKVIKFIERAKNINADLIIFPEACLLGGNYPDVLEKFPIIEKNNKFGLEKIAETFKNIKIIIGTIADKKNAVLYINNGVIEKIITSSKETLNINGLKTSFIFRNIPDVNPSKDTELIIDLTPSISKKNSEYVRNQALSTIAKLSNSYVIQVNKVGSNDERAFDGASRLYDRCGNLVARADFFKEDLLIINNFNGEIKSAPKGIEEEPEREFSLNYENDLERTYMSVFQSTRDYFYKNSLEKAVIGLSGGLDSTVCAVILADVLGAKNVYGFSMPSKITTDLSKQDAFVLAQNLGINFNEIPISPMVEAFKNSFGKLQGSYTMDNFQARVRATILFGYSNEIPKCISIATSDKSEAYMGYATINGDMSGGFAPIADITKTKLFALAEWINKNKNNVIPQSVINKRPGAELAINPKTGKPLMAEEALMPYEFLDEIIWQIEIHHKSKNELRQHKFIYEKTHETSQQQKEEWINKFFCRMLSATCKGNLMPVYPLVDEVSINKKVYNTPITTRINFEELK